MALAELQHAPVVIMEPTDQPPVFLQSLITGWSDDQIASIVNAANISGFGVHFENATKEGRDEISIKLDGYGNSLEFYSKAIDLLEISTGNTTRR